MGWEWVGNGMEMGGGEISLLYLCIWKPVGRNADGASKAGARSGRALRT